METLRSQHYETENANKENSSEFKFITKLGQSIQKLKENLKKFISAPEEEGSGLKEVPIKDDVQALVREFIEATDDLKDEYGLYSSSSGDSTPENHIIIPNQPILTQGINEMKKYVESNNHKDTGSYVAGIDRIIGKMMRIARTAEEPVETAQGTESEEGEEYKFPEAEALQAELDRLIEVELQKENNKVTEKVGKLAKIEGREYTGEVDSEETVSSMEVDILRENARQSILEYQKFIEINRNNLKDEKIYNQYRIIEKKAWSQVSKFAYKLGGEMETLSQERDIQLAHPEVVDIEQYLVDGGKIVLDAEGHITHLNINGDIIELNRPRTIDELLKSSRPTRILYHSGTPISEDDPTKQNYKGLVIEGLNENTLAWIEGILSNKQFLGTVIVDETRQSTAPITEVFVPTENNPEASTEKEDPLESYRNKGFDKDQLAFIENAIDAGDTPEQIALYAKSEYEVAQMIVERAKKLNPELDISQYEGLPYWQQTWIITGILAGHTPEQIALYAKPGISNDEIAEIQSYIESGLTIEKMIEKKIIEIAKGYLNVDIGFSRYSLIEQLKFDRFTDEQATQAIDSMDIDWKEQAIKKAKSYLQSRPEDNENWSRNELIQQLKFEEFTNDQAISAVNSITDYDWEEDSEVGEPEQSEVGETTPQGSLDDLRLAYARAEEAWNRKRGDEQLKDTFISAREAYNTELERVLKLQVAKGQADTISQMFKKEVIDLRDSRTTQSQELQGKWEKRFNNAKEKFLGWATKNKTRWMLANMGLFAAGALLSSIGVGIPVTGALEMTRRSLGSVMAGVGSRNTLVGLMEDRDIKINKFGLNINFQAEVPKIVKESISEEDKIKAVSEDVLKERLGTLEAYYRLNGGKFTNDNQQQAYEKVLTELARRVQENVIDAENPNLSTQPSTNEQSENEKQNPSTEFVESDKQKLETDRYTSELLNTISDKRIAELDKFRRKRQIANVVGFATTGVLGGLLLNDMLKPGGIFRLNIENGGESANNGVSTTPEVKSTGADTTSAESSPTPQASPTQSETPPTNVSTPEGQSPGVNTDVAGGTGTSSGVPKPNLETTTTTTPTGTGDAVEAAAKQAQELAQDVSNLDSGETIWGEITKQLGENASQAQIQQEVENYLQSQVGQESIFELAKQTEGGREFLARWSIDNAGEMARLELKDLYEVSKYLGEGELEGLTKLSLDNLDALSPAEYTAPSPLESPVNTSQFTKSLSEAIGANNLTDSQIGSVLEAYADTDQGRKSLYELIITSKANNPAISEILDRYNITYEAQLSDLPADQLNILAQKVGVENLNQLPGFKLNEIILSKFEDAPYMVDLARGTRPLDVVQRYIANELGNLPYDSNLGKQVLDTYVQTDAGKQWLYDAIVSNPNPNNQNVQSFREYLSYKGIKSAEDFKALFNWAEFSRNSNIPTSGFWNQIRLPNRNILQPLSTFLQPSKMIGIKDAVRQVLTG